MRWKPAWSGIAFRINLTAIRVEYLQHTGKRDIPNQIVYFFRIKIVTEHQQGVLDAAHRLQRSNQRLQIQDTIVHLNDEHGSVFQRKIPQ